MWFTHFEFIVGWIPGFVNLQGSIVLRGPRSLVSYSFMDMYYSPSFTLNPSTFIVDLETSSLTILPVDALSRLGKRETTSLPMMHKV